MRFGVGSFHANRALAAIAGTAAIVVVVAGLVLWHANPAGPGHETGRAAPQLASATASGDRSSTPTKPTSVATHPVAEPIWVRKCIRTSDRQTPEYVGLSLADARTLAARDGATLIGYAGDGACLPTLLTIVADPVAIALTGLGPGGTIPPTARVVYAAHVNAYTGK